MNISRKLTGFLLILILCIPIAGMASELEVTIAKLSDEGLTELYSIVWDEMDRRSLLPKYDPMHVSTLDAPFSEIITGWPSAETADHFAQATDWQGCETETFVTYDPPAVTATPTPVPTFAPLIHLDDNAMVWISKSGKRYHTIPTCSHMTNPVQIPLAEALTKNRTPCRDCAYWMIETEIEEPHE